MIKIIDPLDLAQRLIRCPSVTPDDGGALDTLQKALVALGFECKRLKFDDNDSPPVDNLYARLGNKAPNFCFAGHTDVVPVGDLKGWTRDPFGAEIIENTLYGRGATDMKSAIASFVAGTSKFLQKNGADFGGSISLLITGDEEGPSINGTKKVLSWMEGVGEELDACLVGEPTNPRELGEMVKIGRRGSLSGSVKVYGVQGHTAYPHLAKNPLYFASKISNDLYNLKFNKKAKNFPISNLEITSIDTCNKASNVIPSNVEISFNVRFNNCYTSKEILANIKKIFEKYDCKFTINVISDNEPFYTPPDSFVKIFADSVKKITGKKPLLSTTGGTSDARYIKDICPVIEFGAVGKTMHQINENVFIKDLVALQKIYQDFILKYNELYK